MSEPYRVSISGLGAYIPERVLTNFDLEKMVETSDEWIRTRTGIRERHIAAKGESASDLGSRAALAAIEDAKLTPADIELIVVSTTTPDMLFPSTACYIQTKIGAKCGAFDLLAACSGFPYALSVAEAYVRSGRYKHVLVVGAELLSAFINWKDRGTCVLFGDGAGAAVVSRSTDGHGIIANYLGSDGSQADMLQIPAGGSMLPTSEETLKNQLHTLRMQGSEVFKVAVRTMELAVKEVLKVGKLEMSDIDWLIPHQANMRILEAVRERLGLPAEKIFVNLDRYGNMSSASTIVALCEAVKSGKVKKGDDIVLVAFGGGLTWASTLIKW